MAESGVEKVLQKLRTNLEAGSYYEAQQMFKTVYHRYRSRKLYADSYTLAEEGARLQLEKGQLNCGVELAKLLLEAYEADDLEVNDTTLRRIWNVLHAFPQASTSDAPGSCTASEATQFINATFKWATRKQAHAALGNMHAQAAQFLWDTYGQSQLQAITMHFLRSDNLPGFASVLAQCVSEAHPDEEDLFLTRAVLQLLSTPAQDPAACRKARAADATELLESYQAITRQALPDTPVMHFTQLLVQAVERESLTLTRLLQKEYRLSLQRDPALQGLLDKVEAVCLGVKQGGGMGNILSDMLKTLAEG
ncbi:hypothetical protein WJX72_003196 [[Myrmecia] bisecta]|uniref:Golgi to ER traffic protein 4 homolog n=1 Tax=[Myrmecia] bisecta TaxID=41462 RepID=A0AAW1PL34_9CHLO